MARRMRDPRVERSLFSWWSYAVVLFAFAAAITVTFSFLFHGIDLPGEELAWRAPLVLANVLFISGLATIVFGLYRRRTTQKPVERILAFTEAITAGDYDAWICERRGPMRNELDVIAQDLNHMAKELGSVEALRTDFVSSVSHEIKTPLSVISNYTTIMRNPAISEAERIAYAEKTGEAARRPSNIVGDILRLNKLDNQTILPAFTRFDLSEQLAECLLAYDEVFESNGLSLEVAIAEGVLVEGDSDLLPLVWNNLISNACKFTDAGGAIRVSLCTEGGEAIVSVSDTGCGIDATSASHVFEKFYQADTLRPARGTD